MAEFPDELRFLETHEWAKSEGDLVVVGISDHAQDALGDVVYVELPEVNIACVAGDEMAVVESVKAASDIYAPVTGVIVAVNKALEDSPELVNESPYGDGWFFKIRPKEPGVVDNLMSAADYRAVCEAGEA